MTFGEKIKKRRKELKWTQAQLANELGISIRTILNYEKDRQYPRGRNMMFKIADTLGVDANYFFMETNATAAFSPAVPAYKLIYDFQELICSKTLSKAETDSLMECLSVIYQETQYCQN